MSDRGGKVFVDCGQNGLGRLLAAPFCVRPVPGAQVSMPLAWHEVNRKLKLERFTIRTAFRRMGRLGADPMAPVLTMSADLPRALERLQTIVGDGIR